MSLNRGCVFRKSACAVVAGYGLRNGRKAEKKDGMPNFSFKPVVRNEMEGFLLGVFAWVFPQFLQVYGKQRY